MRFFPFYIQTQFLVKDSPYRSVDKLLSVIQKRFEGFKPGRLGREGDALVFEHMGQFGYFFAPVGRLEVEATERVRDFRITLTVDLNYGVNPKLRMGVMGCVIVCLLASPVLRNPRRVAILLISLPVIVLTYQIVQWLGNRFAIPWAVKKWAMGEEVKRR